MEFGGGWRVGGVCSLFLRLYLEVFFFVVLGGVDGNKG